MTDWHEKLQAQKSASLGSESRQGAVGLVIDRDYLEIRFPLEEA